MKVNSVLESCIYVDDLDAAESFYTDVLGLTVLSRKQDRHVFFRMQSQMLLIFNTTTLQTLKDDLPSHGTTGSGHIALAIQAADTDEWKAHLESHDVPIEHIADWGDGKQSLYFRDPAGNSVELASPTIWGLPNA